MFTIAVDSNEGTTYHKNLSSSEIHEKLRHIGLEWKLADWAHDQAVIITVAPQDNEWASLDVFPELDQDEDQR